MENNQSSAQLGSGALFTYFRGQGIHPSWFSSTFKGKVTSRDPVPRQNTNFGVIITPFVEFWKIWFSKLKFLCKYENCRNEQQFLKTWGAYWFLRKLNVWDFFFKFQTSLAYFVWNVSYFSWFTIFYSFNFLYLEIFRYLKIFFCKILGTYYMLFLTYTNEFFFFKITSIFFSCPKLIKWKFIN